MVGEILFAYLYGRASSSAFLSENHDIHLFDVIAGNLEATTRSVGASALVELGKRYRSPDSIERATAEGLAAEASRLGVEDIFLIGPNGKVMATSFAADQGLDLFSLGEGFKAFLLDIVGKGRVTSQSLSLSTRTGRINMYQYYSPPGSTVLIEISTSLRSMLARAFPDMDYEAVLSQLLDLASPGGDGRLVWLTDVVAYGPGNHRYWSLLREGSSSAISDDLLAEAILNGESRRASGDLELFVKMADLDRRDVDYFNARFLEVFSIDLRPIKNYRLICLVVGLGIAALISAISWIRARRSFARRVTRRVEAIVQSLKKVELGSSDPAFDPSSSDELSAIGQGIYAMVSALLDKNRELEELSRRLEGEALERKAREERLTRLLEEKKALIMEVQHRVRNNLQVLSSLVTLQAQGTADPAVQDALAVIRRRIIGMSLAHDQLYESDTTTAIDAGRYFGDLARSIIGMEARADKRITVNIDAKGIYISSDIAIPLGLAVGELIANACDHAFPDRAAGEIDIRLERDSGELRVAVSDDGPGSTLRGLGLDIVRILCEQLGGTFSLEARSPRGNSGRISVPCQ